jgi:16S rRNA (guanine966-N2)-methyltransferase
VPPKHRQAGHGYPGKVRIIGGEWRGRRLGVIDSPGFRPTPDRVKETVFNWLQPYLPGARCLDLFAGSGALCLEALSRGASEVVMVEKDARVAANLQRNIDLLQAHKARLTVRDAGAFLDGDAESFDIVFVDPPFAEPAWLDTCLDKLEHGGWLAPAALVYIEASADLPDISPGSSWSLLKSKKTGQVGYHLLQAPA